MLANREKAFKESGRILCMSFIDRIPESHYLMIACVNTVTGLPCSTPVGRPASQCMLLFEVGNDRPRLQAIIRDGALIRALCA